MKVLSRRSPVCRRYIDSYVLGRAIGNVGVALREDLTSLRKSHYGCDSNQSRMKWFRRLPTLVQGLLVLLTIIAVGIVPPSILDEFAVRATPKLPWVAPIALTWMWLVWRYLDQPGWRREHLSAKRLTGRQWLFALAALGAGTGAMHSLRMALLRWLGAPDVSLPNLPLLSVSVLLSSFLVTALSAALFEEAGYRGYFQRLMEERYG
jgi:membrane protease YdiL (CAAX protease family)